MGAGKKIADAALHLAGGGAIAGAILWEPWLVGPALLVVGLLREQAQHRYIFTAPPDSITVMVHKRTFFDFGWLTWHTALEALWWGVGGVLMSVVFECFIS